MVEIQADMPGVIARLETVVNAPVSAGDAIAIIESMKMEVEIASTATGIVVSVLVSAGDQVSEGQCIAVVREG
jgi:biotin carboxyl carrier protein